MSHGRPGPCLAYAADIDSRMEVRMQEFSFSTRIFFGEGALERLRRVENQKVLIVTDRFMVQIGTVDKVVSYLTNCEVSIFDGVVPDPPIEVVAAGVQAFAKCQAEIVIAVGGGSTIDAAKAIRAIAEKVFPVEKHKIECFAVPTTSGTGSEVTDYAVISDNVRGVKYPLDSQALRPPEAILDPSLTVSAPPSVTADAGMDVLTHALEAYVSTNANDFSDAMCEKAISLVFRFLPLAYQDGEDLLARIEMQNAACMAGLAFNSAGLGINHSLAHAIGGKLHIAHGRINAMLLPKVLAFNADLSNLRGGDYSLAAKKYQRIARIMDFPAATARLGVSNLISEIESLNHMLKIPSTLREWGADLTKVREIRGELIAAALADATFVTNPRKANEEDLGLLLDQVLG